MTMEHELIIGKYTLESLTNGMYASPFDLLREYIQNAVDSIDLAVREKHIPKEMMSIRITIDATNKCISVYDNGCGISETQAVSTLIDIGNSNKQRNVSRGFRGIGRLAGLGYCEKLQFITSSSGENRRTVIEYDAALLKTLLLNNDVESVSVEDVMEQIITVFSESEKTKNHYFEVKLIGVADEDGLLDTEQVTEYLVQHAPLPYSSAFKWKNTVMGKTKMVGYEIPCYKIVLNGEPLYKPYADTFIADRVKKIADSIRDISVHPFYRDGELSAVLWYGQISYYGTINDNSIKGIRIRQGNILIGNKSTCNGFFKEERFNGWMLGELHIIDPELIVNSRRDDFEKNSAYYRLVESLREWAFNQSKEIRRISYERSLSREKKAIVEAESFEDVNDLCSEDMGYADDVTESDFIDSGESEYVAESDYIGRLSTFLGQKKTQTKYTALNINSRLTIEQRKVLERVFDLIQAEYDQKDTEKFINLISRKF